MEITITEKEILEKYPKIFQEYGLTIQESCMPWGLEVPCEWLPVIDQLCDSLQHCGWTGSFSNKLPQVIAQQVKEKFGDLRFYFRLEFPEEAKIKGEAFEYYYNYYQGMIDHAANIIYLMEKESPASNINKRKFEKKQ